MEDMKLYFEVADRNCKESRFGHFFKDHRDRIGHWAERFRNQTIPSWENDSVKLGGKVKEGVPGTAMHQD